MKGAALIGIEVDCADPRWAQADLTALAHEAFAVVFDVVGIEAEHIEVSVLGTDDAQITGLNAEFRDKPRPTNVLSWPAQELVPGQMPVADPDGAIPLGDIALAFETCEREAAEAGIALEAHVTHLLVHGLLHLLGHDHEIDMEADAMEALEVEILGKMGLDNPYRDK